MFPRRIHFLISSFFGVGYLPAPGTVATLVAVFFCSVCSVGLWHALVVFPIFLISSNRALKYSGCSDPPFIVVDEIFGYVFRWNVLRMFHSVSIYTQILFFVIFRFFDAVKPFYIKKIERLPDVIGVFLDDIVAAVYSIVTVKLICLIF